MMNFSLEFYRKKKKKTNLYFSNDLKYRIKKIMIIVDGKEIEKNDM